MKTTDDMFSIIFNTDQVSCICEALYQAQDKKKLMKFFFSDPDILRMHYRSPPVILAYLQALFHAERFEELTQWLSSNRFDERYFNDLMKLWYDTKYAEDQKRKNKPLGPVEKYRLRRKFPPPKSISDGEEVVYSFRAKDRAELLKYYEINKYPTPAEKKSIALKTGLKIVQISNWFKNRRQRDKTGSDSSISPKIYPLHGYN